MDEKENQENNDEKKGVSRFFHFRYGILIAAVVVCVAVIAVTIFAVRGNENGARIASSAHVAASSVVSHAASSQPVPTTNQIPVLMYHSIAHDPKDPNNILRVPTPNFAAEMKWLYDNGYKTLTMDQLYNGISNNQPFPQKSVVLTFDDGYSDNYTNALPIIEQYNFKATVFMITSKIGDSHDGFLTADQLKTMDQNGMSIECHTVSHLNLETLSFNHQFKELNDSKTALENLLGKKIEYIAYPYGDYDANTIKAVTQIGYKMCFLENGGIGALGDNMDEFPRFFVGQDLQDFINRVTGNFNFNSSAS